MAFTKERKNAMLEDYVQWFKNGQAVFMLEFSRMNMKEVDTFRARVRDAGGQAHVAKNTLFKLALAKAGYEVPEMEGTTMVGVALHDAPALAKVFVDATKSETFKLKGGFMDGNTLNAISVKTLAELPPLPVMRARILGILNAPATKLVRTLAEPARSLAAVVKGYSEKVAIPEAF